MARGSWIPVKRTVLPPKKETYFNGHFGNLNWMYVPTMYKAYISGLCKGISQLNMALYGTVPRLMDLEIPVENWRTPLLRLFTFGTAFKFCTSKRVPLVPNVVTSTYSLQKQNT